MPEMAAALRQERPLGWMGTGLENVADELLRAIRRGDKR
jgi:hypothetical protein